MGYHYVWLIWSSAFLLPWLVLFLRLAAFRQTMLLMSIFTTPLGLTEPLFVPRYWNPPSLFDLAQRSGFDIESLIFSFAIGGVGAVLYCVATGKALGALDATERVAPRHRYHRLALIAPVVVFPGLFALPWNPIYAAIVALGVGGGAIAACRPDLARSVVIGGGLFTALYAAFLIFLEIGAPNYISQVWNLADLSGVRLAGMPLEELLFGFSFGTYWSGLYEHLNWQALRPFKATQKKGSRW